MENEIKKETPIEAMEKAVHFLLEATKRVDWALQKYKQLQAENERLKEKVFEAARKAIGKYDPNAPPLTKNRFANELVEALRTES